MGQHFLLDPNLARAIVADAGVGPGARVVEIGAGLGSLTVALADAGAADVLAIEFDRKMVSALQEVVQGREAVRVLHADATKLDWAPVLGEGPWILCANLPYNVGTTIVLDVLEFAPMVASLTVMLQREVGDRLVAAAGTDPYGAVSIRVAYRAHASRVRRVPPEVFWPRPGVGSVVVRLDRRDAPPVAVEEARLWRVVDEAFAQRRKTMRNALRRLGLPAAAASDLLRSAGLDPAARAETLTLEDFARLAEGVPA